MVDIGNSQQNNDDFRAPPFLETKLNQVGGALWGTALHVSFSPSNIDMDRQANHMDCMFPLVMANSFQTGK